MSFVDLLFGRPLATEEEKAERIGPAKGIPIFGLDALSSAAYGPEAALTLLIPLGLAGVAYIVPISLSIIVLLGIVYFSYRQTITAYPQGGGSYTVASANLGVWAGLLAAASLMVDYVLTAAVGISAGVGALISAVPSLERYTLPLCLGILLLVTVVNLRGVRETGGVFMIPTYLFIFCLLGAIAVGLAKTLGGRWASGGGHPTAQGDPCHGSGRHLAAAARFRQRVHGHDGRGGSEQRSDGVQRTAGQIRPPDSDHRHRSSYPDAGRHRGSGKGVWNRSDCAGADRVSERALAVARSGGRQGRFLLGEHCIDSSCAVALGEYRICGFSEVVQGHRAERLPSPWFSAARPAVGIRARDLCVSHVDWRAADCVRRRDRPVNPAVRGGAFLAFTLSQAGMVMHWKKAGAAGSGKSMALNALGAIATGVTVLVVLVAKFTEGAWLTLLLIPGLMLTMRTVKKHYERVAEETKAGTPADPRDLKPLLVVLPMERWNQVTNKALRFAWTLSAEIKVVHVDCGEETDGFEERWHELVEAPAREAGAPVPEMVILRSRFRFVIGPIVDYALELEKANPGRQVAVPITRVDREPMVLRSVT